MQATVQSGQAHYQQRQSEPTVDATEYDTSASGVCRHVHSPHCYKSTGALEVASKGTSVAVNT
jgi:hypothetical protein